MVLVVFICDMSQEEWRTVAPKQAIVEQGVPPRPGPKTKKRIWMKMAVVGDETKRRAAEEDAAAPPYVDTTSLVNDSSMHVVFGSAGKPPHGKGGVEGHKNGKRGRNMKMKIKQIAQKVKIKEKLWRKGEETRTIRSGRNLITQPSPRSPAPRYGRKGRKREKQ